jgi:alpha-D-xyloside xylohydrolase
LTIEDRKGEFPGMLKTRQFQVVLVKEGKSYGEKKAKSYDKTIAYKGKKQIVKL